MIRRVFNKEGIELRHYIGGIVYEDEKPKGDEDGSGGGGGGEYNFFAHVRDVMDVGFASQPPERAYCRSLRPKALKRLRIRLLKRKAKAIRKPKKGKVKRVKQRG
jgi:hypothetical protein